MKRFFLALPSVLTSLVAATPVLTCPACWPLYAGLLSALGLGFVDYTPYLLPATALMLLVSLLTLGWRAEQRRGYAPLAVGGVASALLLAGKFYLASDPLFYAGVALLIGAAIWNIWPKNKNCEHCSVV
jgi:hypothetical protein